MHHTVFILGLLCVSAVSGLRLSSIFSPFAMKSATNKCDSSKISIAKACAIISIVSSFGWVDNAQAGWFASPEQQQVDKISMCQRPVAELLDQLRPADIPNPIGVYTRTQLLKGGKEDSIVVQNYLSRYIQPCQEQMAAASKSLSLKDTDLQKKLETLPLLMKGHIVELQQAIASEKAEEQAREVEEVQETLADFLRVAQSQYDVTPYKAPRMISDKELFGPLGCEFWGKVRVPGSNACVAPDAAPQT